MDGLRNERRQRATSQIIMAINAFTNKPGTKRKLMSGCQLSRRMPKDVPRTFKTHITDTKYVIQKDLIFTSVKR